MRETHGTPTSLVACASTGTKRKAFLASSSPACSALHFPLRPPLTLPFLLYIITFGLSVRCRVLFPPLPAHRSPASPIVSPRIAIVTADRPTDFACLRRRRRRRPRGVLLCDDHYDCRRRQLLLRLPLLLRLLPAQEVIDNTSTTAFSLSPAPLRRLHPRILPRHSLLSSVFIGDRSRFSTASAAASAAAASSAAAAEHHRSTRARAHPSVAIASSASSPTPASLVPHRPTSPLRAHTSPPRKNRSSSSFATRLDSPFSVLHLPCQQGQQQQPTAAEVRPTTSQHGVQRHGDARCVSFPSLRSLSASRSLLILPCTCDGGQSPCMVPNPPRLLFQRVRSRGRHPFASACA